MRSNRTRGASARSAAGGLVAALAALVLAAPAEAAGWLPHPKEAEWTYEWTDSVYNRTPTKERIKVREERGQSFTLEWTTENVGNPEGAAASVGMMTFEETSAGIVSTGWQSSAPPPAFPILCPSAIRCGNSMAGTLYTLIWGARAPVLAEPVLRGSTWPSRGGAEGEVTSVSRYEGREQITVPAFPGPVTAVKVRSDIRHSGALGDPYGSGVRTVWWVYGVGPAKIVFDHAGGADAPTTTSVLLSTNRTPESPPPDANYFPFARGSKLRFRWTNDKHLKRPSVQQAVVTQVGAQSARVDFRHVSGPIRLAASYGFVLRRDGLSNIWAVSRAASRASFPPLGPRFVPASRRRRFFTPFDFLTFGLNRILAAYPAQGQTWSVRSRSRDYSVFGVTGSTRVLGFRHVRVPAGRFRALAVRSTLRQAGYRFGSGMRISYFAAGKGLVKLTFRHGDGSTSTVERLR